MRGLDYRKLITFSTLLVATFIASGLSYNYFARIPTAPAFTMFSREYLLPEGGGPAHATCSRVRYVSASGAWREVETVLGEDGSVLGHRYMVAVPGRGVYNVDTRNGILRRRSGKGGPRFMTLERHAAAYNFKRFDNLQGYSVAVTHEDLGRGQWIEHWFAPDLQDVIVKVVNHIPGVGDTVIEMERVEWGEPSPADLALPDYPEEDATRPQK